MNLLKQFNHEMYHRQTHRDYKSNWQRLHLDPNLLVGLLLLIGAGLTVLYSATFQDSQVMIRQLVRIGIAFAILLVFAQIPVKRYVSITPWVFMMGLGILVSVLLIGKVGKGAQRWLELGAFRFQPSELMKLVVPMMAAWYLAKKPNPPKLQHIIMATLLILIPAMLIARQPDLGTAIVVVLSGGGVLLFAGLKWRYVIGLICTIAAAAPFLWRYLHDYQKQRVLTFLNPETDPLGSGYHIIQSKIAIGSGGLFGKGWLNGTQSQLHFLPEHATDFIFAVASEEFGLVGSSILLILTLCITGRAFYIASHANDQYSRLLAASIGLTFFLSAFVNIGMVIGILPVVGLPLPLVSYGGTSMLTIMAGFGILMAIHTESRFATY